MIEKTQQNILDGWTEIIYTVFLHQNLSQQVDLSGWIQPNFAYI